MNISPILLLSIGAAFALFYGGIITFGWAITRRNRKTYHEARGFSDIELFDLKNFQPLGKKVKTISLENNFFISKNENKIDPKKFLCYKVDSPSPDFPEISKGDLILIEPFSNKIKYAFKIPDLKDYR